ncbi:hypothetical protein IscW_ISCW015807 [Ixodes scapularis]|uniref:Uncharacterized protein n=1 Tax=Ixodes scapularis TaxID=6945 RepID=B7P4E4_IXOSC|nr:hypothetical protein IscW_ISCW015807 [Ixodes scapularis]|eukprot:XP_002405910.1 hypothetical protein IscW_ISCW015807 [Ixodes scapularis]
MNSGVYRQRALHDPIRGPVLSVRGLPASCRVASGRPVWPSCREAQGPGDGSLPSDRKGD